MPELGPLIRHALSLLASTRFATVLMGCATLSILAGICLVEGKETTFMALDNIKIQEWARTYGLDSIGHTWWFFIFISAMLAMGLNTAVCTVDRLTSLAKRINVSTAVMFRLSIHGMHLAFLFILLGFGISFTTSDVYSGVILVPGKKWIAPHGELELRLISLEKVPYTGSIAARKRDTINVRATLLVREKTKYEKKRIGLNSALYLNGNIVTIKDFARLKGRKWVMLYVRKDHGIPLYIFGAFFFAISACFYGLSVLRMHLREV